MRQGAPSWPSTSTLIGQPAASMTGISDPFHAARLQGADDAFDEGLSRALIVHELEQAGELARRHMLCHARVFGENGVEMPLFGYGLATRFLDNDFRGFARVLGAQ